MNPILIGLHFFVNFHNFKQIKNGCKHDKKPMLTCLPLITISTIYIIFACHVFHQILAMFICNMFFHGHDAMVKVINYKTFMGHG
jgi:hypothetical protein